MCCLLGWDFLRLSSTFVQLVRKYGLKLDKIGKNMQNLFTFLFICVMMQMLKAIKKTCKNAGLAHTL